MRIRGQSPQFPISENPFCRLTRPEIGNCGDCPRILVSWRLHTIVFLLLTPSFFQLKPSNQPTILSGWKAVWSPYHMVDETGRNDVF
jgi:hypothetical protein